MTTELNNSKPNQTYQSPFVGNTDPSAQDAGG
jgi:hypothetical protein